MDTDINNLLKTDDGKPNESNKDNLSSKAPGSLNTITSLAKRFRSVFVVLYYINIVLIIGFVIFLTIGIFSSRYTPNALFLLVLLGGGVAYIINIFSFGLIATIIKISEDLEKLTKN
tara:strand:- start:670 stop:1020 length:351 start_codon:yes stop_codon:yes gene_type:complete